MDETRFQETIAGIQMPEEMKTRILANCRKAAEERRPGRWRGYRLAAAVCACLLVGLAGLGTWMWNSGDVPDTSSGAVESVFSGTGPVQYHEMMADWGVFYSLEEMLDASEGVFVGTVKDISFQVLDQHTGQPPTAETEDTDRWLYTFFEIEVLASYRGEVGKTVKIRWMAGLQGFREEEQRAALALGGCDDRGIPIVACGSPDIQIGETYLFLLGYCRDGLATLIEPWQGVRSMRKPLEKDGVSGVSPKDIITSFGKEKWTELQEKGIVS